MVLIAYQIFKKRDHVVNTFNESINNFMIFLITYIIEITNLNFQKDYYKIHIIEFVINLNIKI